MTLPSAKFPDISPSQERVLLGIYAAMSRDAGDALDLLNECADISLLRGLVMVLETPGSSNTDHALNAFFVPLVRRRLANLSEG